MRRGKGMLVCCQEAWQRREVVTTVCAAMIASELFSVSPASSAAVRLTSYCLLLL